jgi:hypothetical protein
LHRFPSHPSPHREHSAYTCVSEQIDRLAKFRPTTVAFLRGTDGVSEQCALDFGARRGLERFGACECSCGRMHVRVGGRAGVGACVRAPLQARVGFCACVPSLLRDSESCTFAPCA